MNRHPLPEARDITAFKRARKTAARLLVEQAIEDHDAIIEAVATAAVVATAVTNGEITDEVLEIALVTYSASGGEPTCDAKTSVVELLEAVLVEMRGPA
jgi:hypothetical protein